MPPLPPLAALAPYSNMSPHTHSLSAQSLPDTAHYFAAQRSSWSDPEDIFTILMLLGADVVQRAIAQLAGAGPGPFTPVAFSFGWVAYSVCALTSAIGNGRLMPPPDFPLIVANAKSGQTRDNNSWVLGRLFRDHEHVRDKDCSITVQCYDVKNVGKPAKDWVYWTGVLTILLQLAISLVPGILRGNWIVLVTTIGGTVLAQAGSGLSQWHMEKYDARPVPERRDVICLTRGNGSTFVMVLISNGVGVLLEDLANAWEKNSTSTSFATATLSALWIVLLLMVEGLDGDAWFMLVIGGLGMVQNVVASGVPRSASALGFTIDLSNTYKTRKKAQPVHLALYEAEQHEPGLGRVLLDIFYPAGLREESERAGWDNLMNSQQQEDNRESMRTEYNGEFEITHLTYILWLNSLSLSVSST